MAFSDVEKEKDLKRNVPRAIDADTNKRWSDKQKLEAVQSFLVLGNISLVGRILGIPRITLMKWKASNWWHDLVDDMKIQERMELSHKMKRIVEAAHAVVEDRLLNGDAVLNQKTGQVVRKPVAMKDAHRVAVDLTNQRDAVEKMSKGVTMDDAQNVDKLEALATKFAEFATKKIEQKYEKKKLPMVEVLDVKDNYAVDEGREEGLSEGIRFVSGETGTDSTPNREDHSEATS